jgi:hypothetical protein
VPDHLREPEVADDVRGLEVAVHDAEVVGEVAHRLGGPEEVDYAARGWHAAALLQHALDGVARHEVRDDRGDGLAGRAARRPPVQAQHARVISDDVMVTRSESVEKGFLRWRE